MDKIIVNKYYNWFDSYVKTFYVDDSLINQNIKLKEEHTYEVAKHAKHIAKSLNLSSEEIAIAELIGLFHDIGRFLQFTKYKTFIDSLSENHALLGINVLEENKVLDNLNYSIKNVIVKAISLHNTKELPNDLNAVDALYCKIIRDADKLDIFRVVDEYEKERETNPNPALDNLPFTEEYSKVVIADLLNNRSVGNSSLKCYYDRRLYELSWIFDLNFRYSFSYIDEKHVLTNLINCLPQNQEINDVYNHLQKYIASKTQ